MLQFMGSQRVRHDLATELNCTDAFFFFIYFTDIYLIAVHIKTFISLHFVPIKYTKSQTKHVCLVCMYVDKHVCMLKILSPM